MIREARWSFGAVLPQDVRSCLSEAEVLYQNFNSLKELNIFNAKVETHC